MSNMCGNSFAVGSLASTSAGICALKTFYKLRVTLLGKTVGLASLLLCAVSAGALPQSLTPRQNEIVKTVIASDGWITQAMHQEFWSAAPASLTTGAASISALKTYMDQGTAAGARFQRSLWASLKLSLDAKRIVKTAEYEAAKAELLRLSEFLQNRTAAEQGVAKAEATLEAAASGKPMSGPNGALHITPEMIESTLAGLDAAIDRFERLSNPRWQKDVRRRSYPEARLEIVWDGIFIKESQKVTLAGGAQIAIHPLTFRVTERDYVSVAFTHASSWASPEQESIKAASDVLRGMGIPGFSATAGMWRYRVSADATGSAGTSNPPLHAAVRVVQAGEYGGYWKMMAISGTSLADAIALRGELEQAIVLPVSRAETQEAAKRRWQWARAQIDLEGCMQAQIERATPDRFEDVEWAAESATKACSEQIYQFAFAECVAIYGDGEKACRGDHGPLIIAGDMLVQAGNKQKTAELINRWARILLKRRVDVGSDGVRYLHDYAFRRVYAVTATKKDGNSVYGSAVAVDKRTLLTDCAVSAGTERIEIASGNRKGTARPGLKTSNRCLIFADADLPFVAEIGEFGRVNVGQRVFAMSAPVGGGAKPSFVIVDGIVAAKRTEEEVPFKRGAQRVLLTTAPLMSGSAGGILFNSSGAVIGVTTVAQAGGQSFHTAIAAEDWEYEICLSKAREARFEHCTRYSPR